MFRHFRSHLLAVALLLTTLPALTYAAPIAPAKPATTAAGAAKIDINTATVDQLKVFPGIGDAYSKRIVDGRPYANKSQLLSKGILPAATYNKIKEQIIATQPKK
jgi:competence protein ComEA